MKEDKKIKVEGKLIKYLGSYPRIKIIEFLINNKDQSWTLKEIIKIAQVKYRNTLDELNDLVIKDIVKIDRIVGKSKLYKINEENIYIKGMIFSMKGGKKNANKKERF